MQIIIQGCYNTRVKRKYLEVGFRCLKILVTKKIEPKKVYNKVNLIQYLNLPIFGVSLHNFQTGNYLIYEQNRTKKKYNKVYLNTAF